MTKAILALPLILTFAIVGGGQEKSKPHQKLQETSPTDVDSSKPDSKPEAKSEYKSTAKPEAKEPLGPPIPVDIQNTYLKINLKLKTEQQAIEQTPLYQDIQKVGEQLNESVVVMQKICGDKYIVNLDQDQTPVCVTKPKTPEVKK